MAEHLIDTERSLHRGPWPQVALDANRVNLTPERLVALMNTRRELLEGLDEHPEWAGTEAELSDFLKVLLNSRRLQLVRIDRHTPTPMLDQIVAYEAVHRIRDARDLDRRLAEDRRCYAFVHPALPTEPLIFAELALTDLMSSNAQALLDPESPTVDPSTCTCATFYSINSCHEGLRGVPLGNALIARVADELARAFPGLETFATLSPVPSFRSWLTTLAWACRDGAAGARAAATLASLQGSSWYEDVDTAADVERLLVPLCAYYVLRVERGDQPADPVARFHLRNGARLDRINWLSDPSADGLRQGVGLMVNYVYRCTNPRRPYDAFSRTQAVTASREVTRLARHAALLFCR